ncbi:MAG: hypothetical protein O3A57_08170 [Bacteroidetes bacterium]|nr:hypothetical protein [Bacteroidota bacterium]
MGDLLLIVDAMCLTLAWLVQGGIYPTFRFVEDRSFGKYHSWYTSRITLFVAPLMIAQLLLHSFELIQFPDIGSISSMVFVLIIWGITGIGAVPAHGRLGNDGKNEIIIAQLLNLNLLRTLLWTAVPFLQYFG